MCRPFGTALPLGGQIALISEADIYAFRYSSMLKELKRKY